MKMKLVILAVCCFAILICSSCKKEDIPESTTKKQSAAIPGQTTQTGGRHYSIKIPTSKDDPYSYIVEKEYKQFEGMSEKSYLNRAVKYNLYAKYDLDGDGVEELLLTIPYEIWNKKTGAVFDRLFTIENGEAKEVIYRPVWRWSRFDAVMGGRDVLSNGIIRHYGGTPEYTSYYYFRYADGELEFLKGIMRSAYTGTDVINEINGQDVREEITEEDFYRLKAEIEDGAEVVDIDWQPLESYGQ